MESILESTPPASSSPAFSQAPPSPDDSISPSTLLPNGNGYNQPFRADIRQASLSRLPFPRARGQRGTGSDERSPLLPPLAQVESDPSYRSTTTGNANSRGEGEEGIAGGTILGIHNLSIVAPQFLIAIIAAIIFRALDWSRESSPSWFVAGSSVVRLVGSGSNGVNAGMGGMVGGLGSMMEAGERGSEAHNDVVWVLRFGGLAALGGAIASRWLIQPRSEKEYLELLRGSDWREEEDGESEEGEEEEERF